MRRWIYLLLFVLLLLVVQIIFRFLFRDWKKWKRGVLGFCIAAVLTLFFFHFPVENVFLSFEKPEEAFRYASSAEIDGVLCGKESAMILYSQKNGPASQMIFPMKNGKYKLPDSSDLKCVNSSFMEDGSVLVFGAEGTKDYYVVGDIVTTSDTVPVILDNAGSRFEIQIGKNCTQSTDYLSYTFWAYAFDLKEDYSISVNGQERPLRSMKKARKGLLQHYFLR